MNIFKSRVFRQGAFATAITILGIVMIFVVYAVLSNVSQRFHWRLDLTPNRMFELTQESIDFLANLETDVNIYVLNTEDGFVNTAQPFTFQVNEVIRMYERFGNRVNLEYIDIVRNPTFAARFSELDLRTNQVLIESPETGRTRVLMWRDLLNVVTGQGGQTTIRSSRAEQAMTSAILNVTTVDQVRVSVLSGYGQSDFSPFLSLLEMNNYEIVHENLVTIAEIDPEATFAFLIAPARDISEDDLRKLDRFLDNDQQFGRHLFFVAGAQATPMSQMPNLSAWLMEWGILVEDSVLFETDINYRLSFDDPLISLVDYSANDTSFELAQTFLQRDLYVASLYSSPLTILFEERGNRIVVPLLQTSAQSGILDLDRGEIAGQALTGPHPVLTKSTMIRFQGTTRLTSNVIVMGSLASFSPMALGEVNFANSEYFLNLIDSLADREGTVRIQDKLFSINTLQMTLAQARTILIIFMVILPIGVLASGLVVWLRRRHR